MQLEIKFQTDHLKRALAAARQATQEPTGLLESIGESLLPVNQRRHEAGVDPDGNKWKALAESTKKFGGKRRGDVLKKTGDMLSAFHYSVTDDVLRLGFDGERDSKLANIHHGGADPYTILPNAKKALAFMGIVRKRVNHPGLEARPLVGFPESDQKLAEDVIEDYLVTILNSTR